MDRGRELRQSAFRQGGQRPPGRNAQRYDSYHTYGVPWRGRHPRDPRYDPYYDDPHHYSGGCDGYAIGVCIFVFIIIALFFASWWWAVPYNHTHEPSVASLPMSGFGDGMGSGGEMIPGLGLVSGISRNSHHRGPPPDGCPPGARWNMTMRMCKPRLNFPVAVDVELMDVQTHMCDSFYKHTCGSWLTWQDTHHLEDRGGYADRSFSYLYRHNQWMLDRIVDREVGGTPLDNFYHSCINALVKRKYIQNAKTYRNSIMEKTVGSLRSMSDLPVVLARLVGRGFVSPITFGIEKHPSKPMMVPFWGHDGFPTQHITRDIVQGVFELLHPVHIASRKTLDFMSLNGILEEHRPSDEDDMGHSMREYIAYLSSATFERDMSNVHEMHALMQDGHNGWSMDKFIHALDYHKFNKGSSTFPSLHPVWVRNKRFYRWFFGTIGPIQASPAGHYHEDAKLRRWKAWVEFSVIYGTHDFAPALQHNVYYHGHPIQKIKTGSPIVRGLRAPKRSAPPVHMGNKRKRGDSSARVTKLQCSRITQELMAGHVAKQFLRHTYAATKETHDRILDVVKRIRGRLVKLVNDTWWFDDRDRKLTVEKLEAIIIRVAQPHHWTPEPFGDKVALEHYWRNLDMARRYHVERNWDKWDSDLDKAHALNRDAIQRFGGALSTVNAYYSPMTS